MMAAFIAAACCTGTTNVASARAVLSAFDAGHRHAAQVGGKGMGGAISANEWARTADCTALGAAVRTMGGQAERVMLGICADDATSAVDALKSWVSALSLPRGTLHGMDKDGVPLDMTDFGSCYIKYNSLATESGDPAGSATLSGYDGDFRGVYFTLCLGGDTFAQFGVLPLGLFGAESARPIAGAERAPSSGSGDAAALSLEAMGRVVQQLQPDISAAGGSLRLVSVSSAEGSVTVELDGPARLRNAVELALRTNKLVAVRSVVFL